MRCNCPHYHIPSADPNDSKGCPVHDPNYVDYRAEYNALKREHEECLGERDGEIKELRVRVKELEYLIELALAAGRESIDEMLSIERQLRTRGQRMVNILTEA